MDNKMTKVNGALGRYYKSNGTEYNDVFTKFCDENDMDEEAVNADMNGGYEDSIFPDDFVENFPGIPSEDDEDKKKEYIFNILSKCWNNPDIEFESTPIKIDEKIFENIDDKAIETIKNIYENQCPAIFNRDLKNDRSLLSMLVIGKQIEMDYLLNLVDSYDRWRINNPDRKSASPADWASLKNNKHFKTKPLKDIQIKISSKPISYSEFAISCMASFSKRCCSKLILKNQYKIDDSIRQTVAIINSTIDFISNCVKSAAQSSCPFQIDVVLSTGKPSKHESKDGSGDEDGDDDDDDDDDDEEDDDKDNDDGYADYIGDIKAKLENNKLKYSQTNELRNGREFQNFFDKFKKDNKIQDKDNSYLRDKRFIILFDRRKTKTDAPEKSDIFLYSPPGKHSRDIPKGAVPEWCISAARTCLLPPMIYNEDEAIGKTKRETKPGSEKKDKSKDYNISGAMDCKKSALLTISFYIRSADSMKAYLYFNGQIIRFMPDDIKELLPLLYNMDFGDGDNESYIKDKELDGLIEEMKKKLVDEQFAQWEKQYPIEQK